MKATIAFPYKGAVVKLELQGSDTYVCPGCDGRKTPGNSFCPRCYFKLNRHQRNELYKPIGNGYELAFADALQSINSLSRYPH